MANQNTIISFDAQPGATYIEGHCSEEWAAHYIETLQQVLPKIAIAIAKATAEGLMAAELLQNNTPSVKIEPSFVTDLSDHSIVVVSKPTIKGKLQGCRQVEGDLKLRSIELEDIEHDVGSTALFSEQEMRGILQDGDSFEPEDEPTTAEKAEALEALAEDLGEGKSPEPEGNPAYAEAKKAYEVPEPELVDATGARLIPGREYSVNQGGDGPRGACFIELDEDSKIALFETDDQQGIGILAEEVAQHVYPVKVPDPDADKFKTAAELEAARSESLPVHPEEPEELPNVRTGNFSQASPQVHDKEEPADDEGLDDKIVVKSEPEPPEDRAPTPAEAAALADRGLVVNRHGLELTAKQWEAFSDRERTMTNQWLEKMDAHARDPANNPKPRANRITKRFSKVG